MHSMIHPVNPRALPAQVKKKATVDLNSFTKGEFGEGWELRSFFLHNKFPFQSYLLIICPVFIKIEIHFIHFFTFQDPLASADVAMEKDPEERMRAALYQKHFSFSESESVFGCWLIFAKCNLFFPPAVCSQ